MSNQTVKHFFVITVSATLPRGTLQFTRSGCIDVEVAADVTAEFVYKCCLKETVEAAKEAGYIDHGADDSVVSVLFWSLTRNDLNLEAP